MLLPNVVLSAETYRWSFDDWANATGIVTQTSSTGMIASLITYMGCRINNKDIYTDACREGFGMTEQSGYSSSHRTSFDPASYPVKRWAVSTPSCFHAYSTHIAYMIA